MLPNRHSNDAQRDMTHVRIAAIYPPVKIDVDLYLPAAKGKPVLLYASAANPPKAADLDKLFARGMFSLLVPR